MFPHATPADEIGAMAKAVEVFKENAIERSRLEAAHNALEAQGQQEKQAALMDMAEKIEAESGRALDSVGTSHECDRGRRRRDECLRRAHRRFCPGRGDGGGQGHG